MLGARCSQHATLGRRNSTARVSKRPSYETAACSRARYCSNLREPNREGGASAQGGSHFDSPSVRAGDASDRGQPQPRAVGIRAEEGTEDPRQIFFGDATAVVFDFDNRFPARPIITVALAQSHDHNPVSVNSLNSVSDQPMCGDFDLRRVYLHDDRNWAGDEFDLDLTSLR